MARYTTRDGDMLDAICDRHYRINGQSAQGALERVLDANPGLCEHPAVLPAGLVIELPRLQSAAATDVIELFD